MAKNIKDLQAKMSQESQARSEAKAERLIQEMALDELRAARALTQEHLSTILGVQQSAISKLGIFAYPPKKYISGFEFAIPLEMRTPLLKSSGFLRCAPSKKRTEYGILDRLRTD